MTARSPVPGDRPLRRRRRTSAGARTTALFIVLLAVGSPSTLAHPGPGIAIDSRGCVYNLDTYGGHIWSGEGVHSASRQSRYDQASAAIDSVYQRFSAAYRMLNADSVAVLYTEDALYLQPRGDMVRGREWSAPDRGKFATVWKRGDDGRWRIHVDIYSSAPKEPDDGAN